MLCAYMLGCYMSAAQGQVRSRGESSRYGPVLRTTKRLSGGTQYRKEGKELPVKTHIQNQSRSHF